MYKVIASEEETFNTNRVFLLNHIQFENRIEVLQSFLTKYFWIVFVGFQICDICIH